MGFIFQHPSPHATTNSPDAPHHTTPHHTIPSHLMASHPVPWHSTPSHPTAQSSEAARTAMIGIMQEGTGQVKQLVKEVKKQGEGPLPPSSPDWLKKDFGTWLVENAIDFAGRLASEGGLTFAELALQSEGQSFVEEVSPAHTCPSHACTSHHTSYPCRPYPYYFSPMHTFPPTPSHPIPPHPAPSHAY